MTDGYFSFDGNATIYPVPSITVNSTPVLHLADPVIFELATFFTQVLNNNLQPRFSEEANRVGLTSANMESWIDGYTVAQTIVFPLNPSILRQADFQFPLLSIYPISEEYDQLTLTNNATRRNICISWILPPLTPRQYNRLYPFFGLASKAWLAYGPQGYDPKVNPQGPSFWKLAGLSFGFFDGTEYKSYKGFDKGGNAAHFPSIQFYLSFEERNQLPVKVNFPEDFTCAYIEEDLVDGYNPANPIVNFVDGYANPSIALRSCSPSSGSINGNTLLVIQGIGFLPEKITQIIVCGAVVRQFNVQSPTVIMAITNPGITSGLGNIVVVDNQNNHYTLLSSFTYV